MRFLTLVAVIFLFVGPAQAEDIRTYAARLYNSGGLWHDPTYRGAEVIYRGGGGAAAAQQAWLRSPAHRALLPQIRIIHVHGDVVVGRSH